MTLVAPSAGLVIQRNLFSNKLSDYRLIAFDMDSTLINIECIDEIAAVAGKKEAVARITELAMQGDVLDFNESLRHRLAILKGTPVIHLEDILRDRLRLNPGAKKLVDACHTAGLKVLLISGGFTFFANYVKSLLNIDFIRANELDIKNGQLTGELTVQNWGSICDGEQKRKSVLDLASFLSITPQQCIAVGDGANDIAMMQCCGCSVAYHGKSKVREAAAVSIESGGLDRLLEVLQ